MSYEPNQNRPERRHGPDFVMKFINWVAASVWLLMLTGLILIGYAKPRSVTFFDRSFNVPVRTAWDQELLRNAIFLMLVILGLCAVGLAVNTQRLKRRDDHYNFSLILLGVISGTIIISFVIYFKKLINF